MSDVFKYASWGDLTPRQQKAFGNGCGANPVTRALAKLASGWFFTASCNHHDFGCFVGGSEARRKYCDDLFYKAMLFDAKKSDNKITYIYRLSIAKSFYLLVRNFGKKAFSYREQPIADINYIIRQKGLMYVLRQSDYIHSPRRSF